MSRSMRGSMSILHSLTLYDDDSFTWNLARGYMLAWLRCSVHIETSKAYRYFWLKYFFRTIFHIFMGHLWIIFIGGLHHIPFPSHLPSQIHKFISSFLKHSNRNKNQKWKPKLVFILCVMKSRNLRTYIPTRTEKNMRTGTFLILRTIMESQPKI